MLLLIENIGQLYSDNTENFCNISSDTQKHDRNVPVHKPQVFIIIIIVVFTSVVQIRRHSSSAACSRRSGREGIPPVGRRKIFFFEKTNEKFPISVYPRNKQRTAAAATANPPPAPRSSFATLRYHGSNSSSGYRRYRVSAAVFYSIPLPRSGSGIRPVCPGGRLNRDQVRSRHFVIIFSRFPLRRRQHRRRTVRPTRLLCDNVNNSFFLQ